MKGICSTIVSLSLLLSALLATAAALPAAFSTKDATKNATQLQLLTTPATPLDIVTYRKIILAFTSLGRAIPQAEVEWTFAGADQAINDHVEAHPEERIPNGRFEYRRENGNMLMLIVANMGEDITWKELSRVLLSLYRFMSGGAGVPDEHYQALEFKIQAVPSTDVGFGLIWYFPPGLGNAQKRASLLPLTSIANETNLLVPNATSLLLGQNANDEPMPFPIARTTLLLDFYFLGNSIPPDIVKSTLQGALAKVRPFLDSGRENDPITDSHYQYSFPPRRGVEIRVAVTVFTYHHQTISWRQLFGVLFGLYQFATSFSENNLTQEHYQVLGFRIFDDILGKLGLGTISFDKPGGGEVIKRSQSKNGDLAGSASSQKTNPGAEQLLRLENNAPLYLADAHKNTSISLSAVMTSMVWPVVGTDIFFTFTFLGDLIPPQEVTATLMGAQQYILPILHQTPNDRITNGNFRYVSDDQLMVITMVAYRDKTITWLKLSQILAGMLQFCAEDHSQVLVFEIDFEEQGRVGFGTFLYARSLPATRVVEKRALYTTISNASTPAILLPPPLVTPASVPFPIPRSRDSFLFTDLGSAIPRSELRSNLIWAIRSARMRADNHPFDSIDGSYEFQFENVTIIVTEHAGHEVTWTQLVGILIALSHFVTGSWPRSETHFQALDFRVSRTGQGKVAHGSLVEIGKADSNSTLAARNLIKVEKRIANKTLASINLNVHSTCIPYPIPGTPVTLVITYRGEPIPSFEVGAGLTNALRRIGNSVASRADMPIPGNRFWYRDNVSHLWFNVFSRSSMQIITWQQLSWTISGLLEWMKGDDCRELLFEMDIAGEGMIGFGSLGHDPLRPGLPQGLERTEKRAELVNETILQIPASTTNISLPSPTGHCTVISDVGIKSCFRSFGQAIPGPEVNSMFKGAFAKMQSFYTKNPEGRVPKNLFQYTEVFNANGNRISIIIQGSPRATLVWLGLQRILTGLWMYMKGTRPRVRGREQHFQVLTFDLITFEKADMGTGYVCYTPSQVAVESRAIADGSPPRLPTAAKKTMLQLLNITRLSSSTNDDCIYIFHTGLDLCFRHLGTPIPASQFSLLFNRVYRDLPASEQVVPITSFQEHTLDSSITGQTAIHVDWIPFYEMTYDVLCRIMQGLQGYMIGGGSGPSASPHMQNLQFMLQADGINMGSGQIWHIPRKHGLEKRALTGDVPIQLLNTTSTSALQLLRATAPYTFPIVDTSITLLFFYFSISVPGFGIEAINTLRSALSEIASKVETIPNNPITNSNFQYSKRFGPRKILVYVYTSLETGHTMSWHDLDAVLDGLSWLMQRDPNTGSPCNQGSMFLINVAGIGTIGQGTLWSSFTAGAITTRAEAGLQLSQPYNSSLMLLEDPFAFPVSGTAITLMINFIGRPIGGVGQEASCLLAVTLVHIQPFVDQEPDAAITNNFFEVSKAFDNPRGRLVIRVRSHELRHVSWQDLQNVLEGLNQFYMHDPATGSYRDWACRFQVNKFGIGTIGQGILTFVANAVAKMTPVAIGLAQSSNSSLLLPEVAVSISFPISGTTLTLDLNSIGVAVPEFGRDASYVIVGARLKIINEVEAHPDDRIPNNRYRYNELHGPQQRVSIIIYADDDHDITWLDLDDILLGLTSFMLGDPQAGVAGHDQGTHFWVDKDAVGRIALGSLWSSTTATSVSKRATPPISPSFSSEAFLKTINTTLLFSPSANASGPNSVKETIDPPLPIPYQIEGTPLKLSITKIGTVPIPYPILESLFTGALSSTNAEEVAHPNDSMTFPYFQYNAKRTLSAENEMLSISVHNNMWNSVTWWQLGQILCGVQEFVVGAVGRARAVNFEVLDESKGGRVIGFGLIHYTASVGPVVGILESV